MAAVLFCIGLFSAAAGVAFGNLGVSGIITPLCFGTAVALFFASWHSNQSSGPAPKRDTPQRPASQTSCPDPVSPVLQEIQTLNDAIPDAVMSRKIERIRVLTAKILEHQVSDPGATADLSMFLNYYLPTTLKLLRAYAQLDAQDVEGENISAAKARIEQMMDTVITGFEVQLDKLFAGKVLDISTEITVMEQALRMNGLVPGQLEAEGPGT